MRARTSRRVILYLRLRPTPLQYLSPTPILQHILGIHPLRGLKSGAADQQIEPEVVTKCSPLGDFLNRRAAGAEAEAENVATARFGAETPEPDDGPPIISRETPDANAKKFAKRHCFKEGFLATYFWQGEFWRWNGVCYELVPEAKINDEVYAFLARAMVWSGDVTVPYKLQPVDAEKLIKCLKSALSFDAKVAPPCWLVKRDGTPDARNMIVFRNGLVDVMTGKREPLTPKFWAQSAIDFEYDPGKGCERWVRFLEEVFPGDAQSQQFVEEWLGYNMTEETKFQKAAMFVGESRSGKGTIAWVMEQLVGATAYVALSLNTWVKNENSREVLIGRKSGCFPDVRLRPPKTFGSVGYDAGGLDHVSIETLLSITGCDPITIPRKWIGAWKGSLRMKITFISNLVPNLNDEALGNRLIKLPFGVNFEKLGTVDVDLKKKLAVELPGIAGRCLMAYRRVLERGWFEQPASGVALAKKVFAKTEGHAEFIEDCLLVEVGASVQCSKVFGVFQTWCGQKGRPDVLRETPKPALFAKKLKALVGKDNIKTMRQFNQPRVFLGLRMKTPAEHGEDWED